MVIAGPNLTIDRTLAIDELRPGEVLRFERAVVTPGGKGVNVARVARDLGADAVLVGLLPGRTGVAGAALLGDEGIVVRGVEVGGELRSTAVVIERSGRVTVLNEPGPALAPGEWELYEGVVADALRGERVLACSGSLPPGAPADAYARLAGLAHAAGAVAVVDVGGEQLAAAVAAGAELARDPRDVDALTARRHHRALEAQHLARAQLVDRQGAIDREVGAGDHHDPRHAATRR